MVEGLKREDDRDKPTPGEIGVMVVSAGITLVVIGYLVWQAFFLPMNGTLEASVVATETTPEGDVLVHVRLTNPSSTGYREAEVTVACGEDPVAVSLANIPAYGSRDGVVVCPPGTVDPPVSVSWWVST